MLYLHINFVDETDTGIDVQIAQNEVSLLDQVTQELSICNLTC